MPLPPAATVAALVAAQSGSGPASIPFITAIVTNIYLALAQATLTVPGTGLVAPAGGGPVTGAAVTGTIT